MQEGQRKFNRDVHFFFQDKGKDPRHVAAIQNFVDTARVFKDKPMSLSEFKNAQLVINTFVGLFSLKLEAASNPHQTLQQIIRYLDVLKKQGIESVTFMTYEERYFDDLRQGLVQTSDTEELYLVLSSFFGTQLMPNNDFQTPLDHQ